MKKMLNNAEDTITLHLVAVTAFPHSQKYKTGQDSQDTETMLWPTQSALPNSLHSMTNLQRITFPKSSFLKSFLNCASNIKSELS